jgi:hypothetical protein
MNIEEMEKYLESEAEKGYETGSFLIGNDFHIIRSMSISNSHFIADVKHVTELLDIDYPKIFIHSHINCSSEASKTDMDMKDLWDMEFWIYGIYDGIIKEKKIIY